MLLNGVSGDPYAEAGILEAGGASGGRRGIPMSRSGPAHFLTAPTGVLSRGSGPPGVNFFINTGRGQMP
jgi:hypothetical protein